jgi:hypothetical protein
VPHHLSSKKSFGSYRLLFSAKSPSQQSKTNTAEGKYGKQPWQKMLRAKNLILLLFALAEAAPLKTAKNWGINKFGGHWSAVTNERL